MHGRFHVICAVTMIFSLCACATDGALAQEQDNAATPTPQSAIEDPICVDTFGVKLRSKIFGPSDFFGTSLNSGPRSKG